MTRLRQLLGELHQRSVWQILGSYAVGSWIILQLAETLAGLIGLPLWFGPTIVALVLLGFPVLLVTSLVQGGGAGRVGASAGSDTAGTPAHPAAAGGDGGEAEAAGGGGLLRSLFTWRHVALTGACAVLLLGLGSAGYSGMRTAGFGPLGSLVAKGVLTDEERVILAHFDDRTPSAQLGETVTALLRIDLAQSPTIILLDQAQLRPALLRMQHDPAGPLDSEAALELAQREGVKAVVVGEVLPLGEGAVIVGRLVQAGGGETLVALRETARRVEEIPEAVDRLSAQLRERIGESLRSIQGNPPLKQVTTPSLPALRKYAHADRANDAGETGRAETLLREALAEDSTFSMAWRKLGILLQNANRDHDQALDAFTRAFEGRRRLTERERFLAEAAYHTYVTEDPAAATERYERLLETYPTDGIALNNLANAYGADGRVQDAADLYLRSIRQGGAPAVTYMNAVGTLFELGDTAGAGGVLEEFRTAYPDNPGGLARSAAFAAARLDYEEADSLVRLLKEQEDRPAWQLLAWGEMASIALVRGQPKKAREHLLQALARQAETTTRFISEPLAIFQARVFAETELVLHGNAPAALAELDRALASLPVVGASAEEMAHLEYARLYAMAGRADRARERLRAYQAEVSEDVRAEAGRQWSRLSAEAAIAQAEGRDEEALRLLVEARGSVVGCPLCVLADLGDAYERLVEPDSAVAVRLRYLDTPDLSRTRVDGLYLPHVLLGLGRAYESLGEPTQAVVYYRRLLALWSQAEPELRPRVERVRARIAELEAGG